MLFDTCSDLHVDIWRQNFWWPKHLRHKSDNDKNVITIVGDIANTLKRTKRVIQEAAELYNHVIFVDGNHEHYDYQTDQSVLQNCNELQMFADEIDNVHYLNGTYTIIDGVAFVGANGWYDWKIMEFMNISRDQCHNAWKNGSNDSRIVRYGEYMHPANLAFVHANLLIGIVTELQDNDDVQEIVMVTHTVPRAEFMWVIDGNPSHNDLSGSYGSSAYQGVRDADVKRKIKVWCFGHTHKLMDQTIDGIRYVCNPRGYPGELSGRWIPIEVDTTSDDRFDCFKES